MHYLIFYKKNNIYFGYLFFADHTMIFFFFLVYATAIGLMLPGTYKQPKSNRCNVNCVETAKIRVKNDLQNRYST